MSTHAEEYRRDALRSRRSHRILIAFSVAITVILIGMWLDARAYREWAADRLDALSVSNDTGRKQLIANGVDPIAPPSDKVLEDPSLVIPPKPISSAALQLAARTALADVLPDEIPPAVDQAVSGYVAACVASGDCVGPAGPAGPRGPSGDDGAPGAPGLPPTPADVSAAVSAACAATLDCEATPDEVAAAVVTYCTQPDQPCGARWTEKQILNLATRATVDYLSGRGIWCVSEDSVSDDQPFGPCYVSSG